jgi:hypothetical protein
MTKTWDLRKRKKVYYSSDKQQDGRVNLRKLCHCTSERKMSTIFTGTVQVIAKNVPHTVGAGLDSSNTLTPHLRSCLLWMTALLL